MFAKHNRSKLVLLVMLLIIGASTFSVMAQDDEDRDADKNKALIADYFEAMRTKEKTAELLDQYIGESDQALKDHIAMFEAGFPQYELIAEDVIAEGDNVVVRGTFRGTHRGEFAGIAATNQEVEVPLIIIYRIEDGKIAEHWLQADVMGLMQQLGALPAPEATD